MSPNGRRTAPAPAPSSNGTFQDRPLENNETSKNEAWDFSAALGLINALSSNDSSWPCSSDCLASFADQSLDFSAKDLSRSLSKPPPEASESSLGAFDNIWSFLDRSRAGSAPPPVERGYRSVSSNPLWRHQGFSRMARGQEWAETMIGSNADPGTTPVSLWTNHGESNYNGSSAEAYGPSNRTCVDTEHSGPQEERSDGSTRRKAVIRNLLEPPSCMGSDEDGDEHIRTRLVVTDSEISRLSRGLQDESSSIKRAAMKKPVFTKSRKDPKSSAMDNTNLDLMKSSAKKLELLKLLRQRFVRDDLYLSQLGQFRGKVGHEQPPSEGIHVFIDISNIWIGFLETIKSKSGLPRGAPSRRRNLSFHNLSLILERGRPVAKRVIVGSDNFDYIQEARHIGYEINLLAKVLKAKQPSPYTKGHYKGLSLTESGSDTNQNHGRKRKTEQGVDEILHLKMLESLLDCQQPSTIVLASGDAAGAEYSEGFARMLERALLRKWSVELVAFAANISSIYRKETWKSRWSSRFSVYELDEYVELLLSE